MTLEKREFTPESGNVDNYEQLPGGGDDDDDADRDDHDDDHGHVAW